MPGALSARKHQNASGKSIQVKKDTNFVSPRGHVQ